QVAFTVLEIGMTWNAAELFHGLPDGPGDATFFRTVDTAEVTKIRTLHEQIAHHDHNVVDLAGPLRQLANRKSLLRASPLLLLGYFAILESLLTHNPKPTDPYDSITRQLKH